MSKSQSNIESSFKQKFEDFVPIPPDHIWEGVKAGITTPVISSFLSQYWKGLTVVAVTAAMIIAGIIFLKPGNISRVAKSDQVSVNKETGKTSDKKLTGDSDKNINKALPETTDISPKSAGIEKTANEHAPVEKTPPELKLNNQKHTVAETTGSFSTEKESQGKTKNVSNKNFSYTVKKHSSNLAVTKESKSNKFSEIVSGENKISEINYFELTKINNIGIALNRNVTPQLIKPELKDQIALNEELTEKKGAWSVGLYLSPEMMLNNFDSVEMLTNYSLGVEPTYYFNNHLFIRFGLNSTYSRDQGFANLDYLSYDLLGTYDYVYDITFDSIDGKVVPTYYTYKMGVWDTVRHFEINTITNQYYYVQVPLLVGYYKKASNFKWYFYGGPAVNLLVSKQIDQPLSGISYIELLKLQKELPERAPYYFQVWIGAGIVYNLGNNLGITFEPNYRYYLNSIFKEKPYNKSGLSGLTLRFGLTYTIQ